MPVSLSRVHRKLLENTTAAARVLAESACSAALENLAVHEKDYRGHMTVEQRLLRNRLRARGRALGDKRDERTGLQGLYHLKELAAYEHWHRLLFTRFLTENHLLITDDANGSVPITLEECEELAPEMGARDGFDLACRFASRTLPGVFRRDDPVLDLPVALNDQVELRKLLAKLPSDCFTADDSLGWTYQFWQAQRKDEVNASGKKIGADELSPVTQLFTEDYMVEFLLHNTLGAWWAGKLGPIQADSEVEARAQVGLPAHDGVPAIAWTYLRFVQDETAKTWLPAAGTFDSWPKTANLIGLLDPCMGSGHFLVFSLPVLVRLRMEEEELDLKAAVVAVLKDNIHGLELDERCTQIAAFNVAITAWKLAGYQMLPQLQFACSGLAPSATEEEWQSLAGNDDRLRRGMMRLYDLFKEAPLLGSLINPQAQGGNLVEANFHEIAPLLAAALAPKHGFQPSAENDAVELGVIAQGLAKAADLLARRFTIVITNVPYLGRGRQSEKLKDHCDKYYNEAKADLATCFVERCLNFCLPRTGSTALVTPQNWLFIKTYADLRKVVISKHSIETIAHLGTSAFETVSGEVVVAALLILGRRFPEEGHRLTITDVSNCKTASEKGDALRHSNYEQAEQSVLYANPSYRLAILECAQPKRLKDFAYVLQGMSTGDNVQFQRKFWETPSVLVGWCLLEGSTEHPCEFGGKEHSVWIGRLEKVGDEYGAAFRGKQYWGRRGILTNRLGKLFATYYLGQPFDINVNLIVPRNADDLPHLYDFCRSADFNKLVRQIDKKTAVTNATIGEISFDITDWKSEGQTASPVATPRSGDPTQWLFTGRPKDSDQPLHAAVARLLGYQWPRQNGSSFPDCPALGHDGLEGFAKSDGIVCLPPVNHEQPAANRLRSLLAAALGTFDEGSLISGAGLMGSRYKTLEDWLRDEFFEQHVKLFHDRPFIWHLWDGRSDGFHALVNYHKLDHATVQKLTYSYLGNWIQQQAEDAKADKPGAAARLGSAQALQEKLATILKGEAPLEIFVRWKPLKDQAQGWHPDLNDGIRQNIRPFLLAGDVGKRGAGLFRTVPLKLKDDDRGSEPHRPKADYPWFWCEEEPGTDPAGGNEFVGARWNKVHLSLDKKRKSKP